MVLRVVGAWLLVCVAAVAQTNLTVEQLLSFIKSSVQLKQTDKQVAGFLGRVRMTEKLDDRTVEEMQGFAVGPRTLAALRELRDQSQSLADPKPKTTEVRRSPIPPPSPEEQARVIDEVRQASLNYTKSLPDFICTQVTRRYLDPSGLEFWQLADTLTARLSYFEQKEDYKLIMVNNRVTTQSYHELGGATSTGEFGSLLREIFDRKSQTRFEWHHWATLRGRRALVFSYRVLQPNSQWSIDYDRKMKIIAGYRGLLYVDRDTHRVLRLTLEAEDIPPSFPVQQAKTMLDYDFVTIGEQQYLLPLKADVRMRSDRFLTRNDVEFRLYRKFSAEAEIKFDTPPPLPEDLTTEQQPN
jgi:hypothetical protein